MKPPRSPILSDQRAPKRHLREDVMTGKHRTPSSPAASRRRFIAGAGLAGIIATGRAPAFAQGAAPKKLVYAHIVPPPESAAIAFDWMAKEVGPRSKGE